MTASEFRKRGISRLRGSLLVVFAAYLFYLQNGTATQPSWKPALFFAAFLASWILMASLPARRYEGLSLQFIVFIFDTASVVAGIYLMGCASIAFYIAAFLSIFTAALARSVKLSCLTAIVGSALYASLITQTQVATSGGSEYLAIPFLVIISLHSGFLAAESQFEEKSRWALKEEFDFLKESLPVQPRLRPVPLPKGIAAVPSLRGERQGDNWPAPPESLAALEERQTQAASPLPKLSVLSFVLVVFVLSHGELGARLASVDNGSFGASLHYGVFFASGGFLEDTGKAAWDSYGMRLYVGPGKGSPVQLILDLTNNRLHQVENDEFSRRESSVSLVPLKMGARLDLTNARHVGLYIGGGMGYYSIRTTHLLSVTATDFVLVDDSSNSGFGGFAMFGVELSVPGGWALNLEGEGSKIKMDNGYVEGHDTLARTLDGLTLSAGLGYRY